MFLFLLKSANKIDYVIEKNNIKSFNEDPQLCVELAKINQQSIVVTLQN